MCGSSTSTSPRSTPPSTADLPLLGDARVVLEQLRGALEVAGYRSPGEWTQRATRQSAEWADTVGGARCAERPPSPCAKPR